VFQNYITSLEIDCMLRIIGKIYHRLSNYKSKIIFPFHDAVVLYIHESEMFLVEEIKKMMESFFLKSFDTLFPVDVKIGKNFLDMESYCG
jgi:DNA polymerase I-like protein with 3'-5' exonuclease and polymerase domains